jgi:Ca-activated chloride channel family protein
MAVGGPTATPQASERPDEAQSGNGGGADEHPGLAFVWARLKIADLSNRLVESGNNEYVQMIRQTAMEYGLMSAYTAFVAVDSLTQTAGDHGTTVTQSVPVPEGTRYETTVEE